MISTWGSAGGLGPIFSSAQFYAPLVSSLALTYGTGSATFTRATTATCFGYAENAVAGASQQLLTIPAGIPRFSGARFKASTNTWDIALSDGTPIPSAQLLGYLSEGAATNFFLNSGAPATQTTGSLGTGTYTCWLTGTGSIAISAGTATITGAGTATAGSPVTFTVTVAGTVVCTVSGTPTTAQVENTAFPTSYIATTGAAVARNADVLSYPSSGNLATLSDYSLYAEAKAEGVFTSVTNQVVIGSNATFRPFLAIDSATFGANIAFMISNTNIGTHASVSLLDTIKIASTFKLSASKNSTGIAVNVNAGSVGTGLLGTQGAEITTINIGNAGGLSNTCLMGNVRNVRIWQTQLPNTTLQAITT